MASTRRVQTTASLPAGAANVFAAWLKGNPMDRDYGYPVLIDVREVDFGILCVEYQVDSTHVKYIEGVVKGLDLAALFGNVDINR